MLAEGQFGFRKNRGAREAILALRWLIEGIINMKKSTYVAFVKLEKAFEIWCGTKCLAF